MRALSLLRALQRDALTKTGAARQLQVRRNSTEPTTTREDDGEKDKAMATATSTQGHYYEAPRKRDQPKGLPKALLRGMAVAAAVALGAAGYSEYAYSKQHDASHRQQQQKKAKTDEVVAKVGGGGGGAGEAKVVVHGRAKVGGPFELVDHHGNTVTDATYRGRFMLVYFGFVRCPDICPDELDKMSAALGMLTGEQRAQVAPLFVTCDPARDTPQVLKEYLADFHPSITGLTGSRDAIARAAKAYRVYFAPSTSTSTSTSASASDLDNSNDYILDHSTFVYLMGRDGSLADVFARGSTTAETMAQRIAANLTP